MLKAKNDSMNFFVTIRKKYNRKNFVEFKKKNPKKDSFFSVNLR